MPDSQQKLIKKGFKKDLQLAYKDLIFSFKVWRIFYLIGISDIRKRYSRSKLGQFWITLSLGINILSLGIVWGYLFKMSVREYLPFIATSMILWNFISTSILDGANLYINSVHYIKELNIPKLAYVNSSILKNLIILGHNLIVLIPIFLFCLENISFLLLCGFIFILLLLIAFLYGIVVIVAVISLRFRDLPNIITSLLQIFFYITPVIWKIELMPEKIQKFLIFNPFCVFITLCKGYLLNQYIPNHYLFAAIIYTLFTLNLAIMFFSKFRSRIVYWV